MARRMAWWMAAAGGLALLAPVGCSPRPEPKAETGPPAPVAAVPDKTLPEPVAAAEPVPAPADPAPPAPPPMRVMPATAAMRPGDRGLQLLAEASGVGGGRRDRTGEVRWTAEPAGVVEVGPGGYVRPVGPGAATVRAATADGSATAQAEVTVAAIEAGGRPWDFAADVVPILTKAGCNTGGCHGKADGQNGFHLSLFGYDPAGDHRAITRGDGGRRVVSLDPEASLLLAKASGRVPHGGGQRLPVGSADYAVLRDWIAAGAAESQGGHGAMTGLAVEPGGGIVLDEPGPQQLRVVATFADGHRRDVTRLASFKSNDDSAAAVDDNGRATLLRRAEADLVVRYGSRVVSTRLGTVINPDLKFDFAALPRRNLIDAELFKRLEALKVPPSPPADDSAFLRRVTLDLTGQQPRPDQIREYLKDEDPDKRAKLVDRLMAEKNFLRFWEIKLGDLLQISRAKFGSGGGPYEFWLRQRLAENAPWDAMVTQLLTSLGNPNDLREGGAINYALDGGDPKVQAELTAQRFLGLRFRCAQCHDHPFDVWTQDDYYGLAAFFAKVRRPGVPGQPGMMGSMEVGIDPKGFVEHLRTKQKAAPRVPGTATSVEVAAADDPRKALAAWMTAPDNPYFARAAANWAWAQFFGRGLSEPADDLGAANPPVHPELLDALAADFVAHKYDLRHLVRTIATSEAYAVGSAPVPGNENDRRLFSHHVPRPLTAHQLADALAQSTDRPDRYSLGGSGGGGTVTRLAIEIPDPGTPSAVLDTFGRCPRTNGCTSVATPQLSLRQSLLLIGGGLIDDKVTHLQGYLTSLLDLPGIGTDEVVENLYLRTLCRAPTPEELSHWTAELKAASSLREAAEDLFWALLNSREFAFNH